jgi:hypothetical protein
VIKSPRALGPHVARSSRGLLEGRLAGHQPASERIIIIERGPVLGDHPAGMRRHVISRFTSTSLAMSTNAPINMPIGALTITGRLGMIAAGDDVAVGGQCHAVATEKSLPRSYCRLAILHLGGVIRCLVAATARRGDNPSSQQRAARISWRVRRPAGAAAAPLPRLISMASLKPAHDLRPEGVSWASLNRSPRTLTLASTAFSASRLRTQDVSKVIAHHVSSFGSRPGVRSAWTSPAIALP